MKRSIIIASIVVLIIISTTFISNDYNKEEILNSNNTFRSEYEDNKEDKINDKNEPLYLVDKNK
ncbi:hypothetical protein HF520_07795 [Romboutsia sp. CE17]|uniref:hypothetical protein n=1 Tax=Romboutsia sp. CE17 TaxID=2724150 RepID=UPI001442BDD1|nr:hypothetical protein [Romboutsia sp. CE17]QJA08854.1 hypothetical protein HF520_07795 [Romboutsia sp. CE17]